jgi:hypothetical protein
LVLICTLSQPNSSGLDPMPTPAALNPALSRNSLNPNLQAVEHASKAWEVLRLSLEAACIGAICGKLREIRDVS